MKAIFGIPRVIGEAPEIPQPHESLAFFLAKSYHCGSKTKKTKRQKSLDVYLQLSRRSLPARQRQ